MGSEGRVLKIVAVGDGFVGKTSLLISHTTGAFNPDYVPTVFDNYAGTIAVEGIEYAYTLWDTAGQEGYDRCRVLCYGQTNVFLICFAVNSQTSFENVKSLWLPEIRRECGDKVPTLLVGTKSDLRKSSSETFVKRTDARKLARTLKMHGYVESSAKDMTGCNEVFEEAVRACTRPPPNWGPCPLL